MADQQVAIVTGASGAVGGAAAQQLAAMGWSALLVGRNREKLEATAQRIRQASGTGEIELTPADVTDPEAVQGVLDQAMERFGQIDAIVNVAGTAPLQPIEKVTPEIWQSCVTSNLGAVVHITSKAWPIFRKQKRGMIANVSSMASFDPFPGFNIYGSCKAGVNLLTQATAAEGKKLNVKTVCVAPGAIETPMLRQHFSEKALPKDKTLAPEEVAQVLTDCVTGERDFTSGETIKLPSP